MTDDLIHKVAAILGNMHCWRGYKNEYGLAYYYAEDELYVIRDRLTGAYNFIYADSPDNALKIYKIKMSKKEKE